MMIFAIICPVTNTVLCDDGRFRNYPLMFAQPKLYKRSGYATRMAQRRRTAEHVEALKQGRTNTLTHVVDYQHWCEYRELVNKAR